MKFVIMTWLIAVECIKSVKKWKTALRHCDISFSLTHGAGRHGNRQNSIKELENMQQHNNRACSENVLYVIFLIFTGSYRLT